MDNTTVIHSLKCIPIPPESEYIKTLVINIESFLRRLRWRIFHISKSLELENVTNNNSDTCVEDNVSPKFGFKCEGKPPRIPDLDGFESDLLELPKSIVFKNVKKNDVQVDLNKFIRDLKQSRDVFVHADKTRNMYRMDPTKV